MKQTLFLCSLAALALASCSNDEEVRGMNTTDTAISFRSSVENATRGTSFVAGANTLDDFKVTCFSSSNSYSTPYFHDVTFTKGTTTPVIYNSTDEYIYPTDATTKLKFYCWAPSSLTGVTVDATDKKITDFQPATTIADQQDVVVAYKDEVTNADKATGTSLNFRHILSQIEVMVKNDNTAYNYTIYGVRIGKVCGKGTANLGVLTGTGAYEIIPLTLWSGWSDKTNYEVTYTNGITASSTEQSVMGDGGNALLIPQDVTGWTPSASTPDTNTGEKTYLAVKICAQAVATGKVFYPFNATTNTNEANNTAWAAIGISENWHPSTKYTYVLDFTHGAGYVDPENITRGGEPIQGQPVRFVNVNVSNWTNTTTSGNKNL